MAIQFFDGCGEYYDSANVPRVFINDGTVTVLPTGGRRGGAAILVPSTERLGVPIPENATVVVGCAVNILSGTVGKFLRFMYNGGDHTNIRINVSLGLDWYNGNTLMGSSAPSLITLSSFHYIECKTFIHDTLGTVEVKLDGATVINMTNVDTKNNAFSALVNMIEFASTSASSVTFDDIYILDTTGSAPQDDFLGDVQVDMVLPDGAGTTSDFDNTTGSANHWENVDENPANDDTDYNSTPTLNDVDLFTFANLATISGGSSLVSVKATALVRRTDAGTAQTEIIARPGITNYSSGTKPLGTGYAYHTGYWDTDPDGGAWSDSTFNASEFGVKVVA